MRFALRMVVAAFALIGIATVSGGSLLLIEGETIGEQFLPALFAAILLALANATIGAVAKVIAKLITFPVGCLTLGLSNLVIGLFVNAGMFYLVELVVDGFTTVDFWPTVLAALIMSVVNAAANTVIDKDDDK